MTTPRAADLPVGSVVRLGDLIATKTNSSDSNSWSVSGLGMFWNYEIDDWLRDGATELRVGDGSDQ